MDAKPTTDNGPARPRERALWQPAPLAGDVGPLVAGGYPRHLGELLLRRGVEDAEAAGRYLRPSPEDLHDPLLLAGMAEAVARLDRARQGGEAIAVVGDYDVDGVTATALLLAVLGVCGLEVHPILPHRMRDGYGFRTAQVERAAEAGARVIVTVDCGTTSAAAIEAALERGIDVIVTDHHLPGADFPVGAIQINPRQPHCSYPFPELSGVGLALKLAQAFSAHAGRPIELAPLLRIACLGTIADLVPLVGENRSIAALGLEALGQTRSRGLLALFEQAGIRAPLRADDVGYRIGPRLNAAGRLASAERALELLLSREEGESASLAAELEEWNSRRRDEELQVVESARALFLERQPLPGILVGWSPDWHRGVVGIAAGRLAKELHRPTILLGVEGEQATGSGRSIPGVSLHSFLEPWRGELERFGGHDHAIGLTVASRRLEDLRGRWESAARWPESILRRTLSYELVVEPREFTRDLARDLLRLEPHGQGNPQPLLRVGPLTLNSPPRLFGNGHLKAWARGEDGGSVWLLGWGWRERAEELSGIFEVLGSLEWDSFLGTPVLRLVDARPV